MRKQKKAGFQALDAAIFRVLMSDVMLQCFSAGHRLILLRWAPGKP